MNSALTHKKWMRACLVSLLTVTPIASASAQLVRHSNADSAQPTHSILEPIPVAQPAQDAEPAAAASGVAPAQAPPSVPSTSMFPQLDLIEAQAMQALEEAAGEDAHLLMPAAYQSASGTTSQSSVGHAHVARANPAPAAVSLDAPTSNNDAIVIHPPTTSEFAPNRHFFQIENTSNSVASGIEVQLSVPAPVRIIEVFPYATRVADRTATYKISKIPAGQSVTVELTTTPAFTDKVVFDSKYSVQRSTQLIARSKTPALPASATWKAQRTKPAVDAASQEQYVDQVRTQVRSGQQARQAWQDSDRLKYGAAGIPGKVMVSNPQTELASKEPTPSRRVPQAFPRSPNPVAVTPKVDSDPTLNDPGAVAGSSLIQQKIEMRIEGPQHAVTGEEAEFQVLVENHSADDASDVLVQLNIPAGLQVTVLDRNAWFDGEARTVTWKLDQLAAGEQETIRYLAKVNSPDGQLQRVVLGVANKFGGQATFQSTVMDQYELAAPLLQFEKDAKSLK